MKTILLIFAVAVTACAQPRISGTNPQFRRNGILYNMGTTNTFTGSGAPGSIAGSVQGDFYLDVAGNQTYQCFGAGPCTAVAAGNWVQVSSSGGSFTNLTVSTLQVTSPLFNAIALTGGMTAGGDLGITGGITVGNGITSAANTNSFGALQLNSTSIAALHIPNGGIQIDGGVATSITAAGTIIGNTFQGQFLQINNLSTFNANVTINASLTASGSITGNGILSSGGITAAANIVSSGGDVRAGGNKARMVGSDGSIVWANGLGSLDGSGNVTGVQGGFSGTVTAPSYFSNTGNYKVQGDNIVFNRSGTNQTISFLVGNSSTASGAWVLEADNVGEFQILRGTGSALSQSALFAGGSFSMINPSNSNKIQIDPVGIQSLYSDYPIFVNQQAITINRTTNAAATQFQLLLNNSGVASGSWAIGSSGITPGNLGFVAGTGSASSEVAFMNSAGSLTLAGALTTPLGIQVTSGASVVVSGGTGAVVSTRFRNTSMPTSCSGLTTGTFINNSGVVNVCP